MIVVLETLLSGQSCRQTAVGRARAPHALAAIVARVRFFLPISGDQKAPFKIQIHAMLPRTAPPSVAFM